jgi:hypothetical protein
MMCMECNSEYVQQLSTARDTLDFCSARCELKNKRQGTSQPEQLGGVLVDQRHSMETKEPNDYGNDSAF